MPKNQPELKLISLEDVVVEPVRWLWYPYIPLGKLSIIHGDPAEGKTTLALWIAAACSRGLALPDGETGEPLTVLYQTAEDGLGDTIKPRLLESKADLHHIYTIDETDYYGKHPQTGKQLPIGGVHGLRPGRTPPQTPAKDSPPARGPDSQSQGEMAGGRSRPLRA